MSVFEDLVKQVEENRKAEAAARKAEQQRKYEALLKEARRDKAYIAWDPETGRIVEMLLDRKMRDWREWMNIRHDTLLEWTKCGYRFTAVYAHHARLGKSATEAILNTLTEHLQDVRLEQGNVDYRNDHE